MKNRYLQDSKGNNSSKRLFGSIMMIYVLILYCLDGFVWYSINTEISITLIITATSLLELDSLTDIWKQKFSGGGNNQPSLEEMDNK